MKVQKNPIFCPNRGNFGNLDVLVFSCATGEPVLAVSSIRESPPVANVAEECAQAIAGFNLDAVAWLQPTGGG